jgi:hypothetical protein
MLDPRPKGNAQVLGRHEDLAPVRPTPRPLSVGKRERSDAPPRERSDAPPRARSGGGQGTARDRVEREKADAISVAGL